MVVAGFTGSPIDDEQAWSANDSAGFITITEPVVDLLIHFQVAGPNDFSPFFGFLGDERSKLFRRAGQNGPA
jgi:hypothetical protein